MLNYLSSITQKVIYGAFIDVLAYLSAFIHHVTFVTDASITTFKVFAGAIPTYGWVLSTFVDV